MGKRHLDRLEYLDYLIRMKSTGSPKRLANKLGISERSVYDCIELLKSLGADIEYNKYRESYCYKEEGSFNFRFMKKT